MIINKNSIILVLILLISHNAGSQENNLEFGNMSAEQISAYEVDVMRKIADLALITPHINTNPLPEFDYDKLDYAMNAGIVRTPKGRLWALWTAGGDNPKAFIVGAISDDDGNSWSKPKIVINSHSNRLPVPRSIIVGNMWMDPHGRLWLFFDQAMDHWDGRAGLWASVCTNPDDENPQWSVPLRIWHGSMINKPIVTQTGEWLLSVQLLYAKGYNHFKYADVFPELDPVRGVNIFASKNNGESFDVRGRVVFPNADWFEPMLVERKDGSLWLLSRTNNGIMESESCDNGKTWSEPVASSICHPASRFHISRLFSGKLLLIKHGKTIGQHNERSQLTAWLSADDGKTWGGGLMLDERNYISYPDATQAADGTIFITYDRQRAELAEILMARITENDITEGKIVSPNADLKILVCKPLR